MPRFDFLRPLLSGLAATVARFPLPLCMALLFAATEIGDGRNWLPEAIEERSGRLLTLAVLGFFWTLSARLVAESRGWGLLRGAVLALAGLGFLALKIFADQPELHEKSETVLFLGPAMILLVMAAPFLARDTDPDAFWDFNRTAWLGAALAFLAALVLAVGLMFAVWAIEELFGLRMSWRVEEDIWILSFALFCPWLALSRIPRRFDAPDGAACPRALSVLIAFILVPLAIGYFVIVYAYIVRILALWELPQSQVGAIVSGYAGFSIATYLAAWPLRQAGPVHVRLFHRHFPYALALPVVLLAVAVAERVSAYGVTEPRYALGALTVWLAGMAGLFIWRRQRLTAVPLTLAVLLAATSFGPWGAADISLRSQKARLSSLLAEMGLFAEDGVMDATMGEVVALSNSPDVVSIVRYLERTGRLHTLEGWFGEGGLAPDAGSDNVLGAISRDVDWTDRNANIFQYFSTTVLSVAGYDQLLLPQIHEYANQAEGHITGSDGTPLRWTYRRSSGVLRLHVGAEDKAVFDLAGLVRRIRERHGDDWDEAVSAESMRLDESVGSYDVRLSVERLEGSLDNGRPMFWGVDVALLLRRR